MPMALTYVVAAVAEIAGCFAFWAWLRLGRSAFWLVPGMASLALFAWALTRVEAECGGRAYAAYGGVYIRPRSPGSGWSKGPGPTGGTFWVPRSVSRVQRSSCSGSAGRMNRR